jgi:hypothetical protein
MFIWERANRAAVAGIVGGAHRRRCGGRRGEIARSCSTKAVDRGRATIARAYFGGLIMLRPEGEAWEGEYMTVSF